MTTRSQTDQTSAYWLPLLLLALPVISVAQVPVDEDGTPLGEYESITQDNGESPLDAAEIPLLSASELSELVGPIALYPDDLLAIVLPAATYPLQVIQAASFLEDLENDPTLKPDESWDDSVVALVNYPEVVELMNEDLEWTWRLGEAVVAQQAGVIDAIETFRDRAYAAGNLKSDERQTVVHNDDVIEITPVDDDVIYVPYYEPERVVVYQPRPVYYYYPRAYPVYYYPYPSHYSFNHGYFWGVTTAFTIGWYTDRLHVHHHSYHGHPYYGRHYRNDWWYRRPSINIHYNYYGHKYKRRYDYHRYGDYWRPQTRRTIGSNHRVTRSRYYPGSDDQRSRDRAQSRRSANTAVTRSTTSTRRESRDPDSGDRIRFRPRQQSSEQGQRNERRAGGTREVSDRRTSTRSSARRDVDRKTTTRPAARRDIDRRETSQGQRDIRFRERKQAPDTRKRQSLSANSRSGQATARRSERPQASVRRSEPRQPKASRSQPRQPAVSRSQPRQPKMSRSQPRQPTVSRSQPRQPKVSRSQPRQPTVSRSQPRQPRVSRSQPRQPTVSRSQPRQPKVSRSQPRQSSPKVSKSSASKSRQTSNSKSHSSDRRASSRRR